jgi:lysozyme
MRDPLALLRGPSRASFALLGGAAVLAGCAMDATGEPVGRTSQAATVCASGSVVQGVDVSVYQGAVNWSDVKAAGIDFAIARISDGSDLDTDFAANWSGMQSAGLVRGAYQYFEPGEDPTTQATIVVNAVGKLAAGDLPVTADMETTGGESAATIAANLQTWAAAVQSGTGKAPMIYTAEGYWNGDVDSTGFGSNPLWVANWGVSCPDLPTGWSNWSFWQDSDSGSVNGISGAVDLDEYNGTLAQLQSFAGGGSTTSSDGGTTDYYAATYVSQSWPLATTSMTMTTCQTTAATLTLKNTGTKAWDTNTRIGTTQPRDRVSVFADATWVSDDRAAQVTGTVAPGDTYEFKFDFHAPPTPGTYQEFFGVVEDGVAWFSDPGQGGPADDDIEANITVTSGPTNCTADPGVPDGGAVTSSDGGGETSEGGVPASDASADDAGPAPGGDDAGTTLPSIDGGGVAHDGGTANADVAGAGSHGCSAGAGGDPEPVAWASGIVALLAGRRRRRARALST